jgi:hypothetical protein
LHEKNDKYLKNFITMTKLAAGQKLLECGRHRECTPSPPPQEIETKAKISRQRKNPKLSLSGYVCVAADGGWMGMLG